MDIISAALHSINILLTAVLIVVYAQNYMKLRSKYTIGLMIFAFILLAHSVMGLYFDASMVMYSDRNAEMYATSLEAAKTASLAVLLWISWE